jgi:MraZ protein
MFQGRFEHTIDDKGRMAIPSAFRKRLLDESGEGVVMLTIWDQCVAAFPLPEWEQKLAAIAKMNQLDPKVSLLKRIFVGCAHECPIDKAGRILVPPELRRDAQLDKDCVILGQLEKFEIWSAEKWTRTFNQLADQVGSVFAALAESGVQI